MSALPFAVEAPIHVSRVALKARDARGLAEFYKTAVGLQELGRRDGVIELGAGGRELLLIEEDRAAKPDDPRGAGLFHTAFLLPMRADLARWLRHAAENRIPVTGASDHYVSEAAYLDDPEGNGIEIYADRPPNAWGWDGDQVRMATVRLDMDDLMASVPAGDAGWRGAPENTVIGHVHLRVGDPKQAEAWWNEAVGLETVARYGREAVFLSSGGYHHHIGANSWRSAGAGPRDPSRAGLAWVELNTRGGAEERELQDPWGTAIRLSPVE
ncbi:MAG TPA: VOC family protein [Mesorhizobium sp.]|nr:VOC family protein [Mesorhizobium sp.]